MSPTNQCRPDAVDIQHLTHGGSLAMRLVGPEQDTATVLLRGAQLVSWVNAQGREMLHSGPFPWGSAYRLRRGGLSLVFPHPEVCGPVSYLRLAQDMDWRVHDAWFHCGVPHLSLRLSSRAPHPQAWPHVFDCFFEVALEASSLRMSLRVVNLGAHEMAFRAAMQPCFRLATSPAQAAPGLGTPASVWAAPTSAGKLVLPGAEGRLEMLATGFQELSVWTPWLHRERGAQTPARSDTSGLVCVDLASARPSVPLAPGEQWQGAQQLCWRVQAAD